MVVSVSLRAMLFDAGDVLYRRPRRWKRTWAYLSELGLPRVPLDHPTWVALKSRAHVGQLTEEAYQERLLDLFGIVNPANRARAKDMLWEETRDIEFVDGVAPTLCRLKRMNIRLGVVTDTEISSEEKLHWFRRAGIDDVWDSFVASCEFKMVKPDARIYLAALEPLGAAPGEAAFVGHAEDELEGARALGMITIAFNGDDDRVKTDYVIDRFEELTDVARELV
jgi:FMN phosphatase YigB (HAD superfamily)